MTEKAVMSDLKSQQGKVVDIITAHQAGRPIEELVLSHESSPYPPSLTRKGLMHQGTKSDILDCIAPVEVRTRVRPNTTVAILEGSVLVRQLRPGVSVYIRDYVDQVFGPHILTWMATHQRVDVVFDTYRKGATRDKRGSGTRRRVQLSTKVPGNWAGFLRVDENKQELFNVLGEQMINTLNIPEVRLCSWCIFNHSFLLNIYLFIST